jgi:hypothetical protein
MGLLMKGKIGGFAMLAGMVRWHNCNERSDSREIADLAMRLPP